MVTLRSDYRYIVTDLLTNEIISEIPFRSVTWGRAVRRAGSFSGDIAVIPDTDTLDLYNSTMPGKTGLYVLKNDVCVWGGIIWSRSYSPEDRILSVSAAEFISYFYHRFIWKTLTKDVDGVSVNIYAQGEDVPIGQYELSSGLATVTTRDINIGLATEQRLHGLEPGDEIIVSGTDSRLNGGQTVYQVLSDNSFTFLVGDNTSTITTTDSYIGKFNKTSDNYTFVKDIMSRVASDFAGVRITRGPFQPGLESTLWVVQKERLSNIARLTVDSPHGLIPGQEVVVRDVGDGFNGTKDSSRRFTILTTPTPYSFEYSNPGDDFAAIEESGQKTLTISKFSVVGGLVTMTFNEDHEAAVGDEIIVDANRKNAPVTVQNPDIDIFDEVEEITEIVGATGKVIQYQRNGSADSFWYFQKNITHRGLVYQASPEKWTVTIVTETAHNYLATGKAQVRGLAIPYDGTFEINDTIPATNVFRYDIPSANMTHSIQKRRSKSGLVFINTKTAHGAVIGDTITIGNYGALGDYQTAGGYNGNWIVYDVLDPFTLVFKKEKPTHIATVASSGFAKNSSTIKFLTSSIPNIEVGMSVFGNGIKQGTVVTNVAGAPNNTVTLSIKTVDGRARRVETKVDGTYAAGRTFIKVDTVAQIQKGDRVLNNNGTDQISTDTFVDSIDGSKVFLTKPLAGTLGDNTDIYFNSVVTFVYKYVEENGTDESPPATATLKVTSSRDYATASINNKHRSGTLVTLTTSAPHGFPKGSYVEVSGTGGTGSPLDGWFKIEDVPTPTTFTYNTTASGNVASAAVSPVGTAKSYGAIKISRDEIITRTDTVEVPGGKAYLGPRVYAITGGGYAENSDILIDINEVGDAGTYTEKTRYIGSNLQTVGELLEEISAGTDGFEYRIDCSYDKTANEFTRTLVLSGYNIPEDPEPGEIRTLESLGADKYVFDYPGNIKTFSLDESAEEAATRMWVTGSSEGMGSEASQPMSAAVKTEMLKNGWPLLDATEQIDGGTSLAFLYNQANSYLEESLPPVDSMTVTVNGSLPPVIGTYKPGDWCSLTFDDKFMKMRLSSEQEVRDNIYVRKILGYTVTVPDSHGVPEDVEIELVRDTEVDRVGDQ